VTSRISPGHLVRLLVGAFLLSGLYIISTFNFLLFHTLVEFFSILVASGTFVVAWNARRFLQNRYFLVVGIAYLSVALLNLMHLITYQGMTIIPGGGADEPTQLWIAMRYLQSLSLLAAPFFVRRQIHSGWTLVGYLAVAAAVLLSVFIWPVFPNCFIEGQGLTFFKTTSEYLISGMLLASIALLLKRKDAFDDTVLHLLVGSIGLAAISGLIFTLYSSVTDALNITGHFVMVLSFYLMYRAVILTGLLKPYDLLFRELKSSEASLLRAQAELERRVEERTQELAQTTEALRQEATEKLASQEALRIERNRLKHIMDSMEVGVCIVNQSYGIEYSNPTLEREFGEIGRKLCYEYFNNFADPCPWCKLGTVMSGKSQRWEWQSPLSGRMYELFDMPLYNNNRPISNLKMVQDITEQYRVRHALRESEERYRRIVETAAEGIWVVDAEGKTSFANQRMAEILGCTVDEILERHIRDFQDIADQVPGEIRFEGGKTQRDFRFLRRNGESVWCLVSTNPIFDEKNRYAGTLMMATDLTERLRLEGQLRESQKMEAVGTLAGGIAHDFNNILAAIIGFTELALENCEDGDPRRRKLTQVVKAGIRGRELVKQILTFSRRSEQQPRPIRVAPLASEAIRLLTVSLPGSIRIEQKIDRHAALILGDPTQIHQVLMNLCSNAIDAMHERDGVLTIAVEEKTFSPGDSMPHPDLAPGTFVRVCVSDNGTGMSPEVREHIFEPFYSTKPSGKGTGLGLSVTYGIVKRHQGVICVFSVCGKGSTFEIFFPAIQPSEKDNQTDTESLPGGTECILLVDDEPQLLEMGKGTLRGLGYRVVTSRTGRGAIKIIGGAPDSFDLVIVDQLMPKMSGPEVSRVIRGIRPDIPIVLCTGSAREMAREEMGESGITEVARKPLMKREIAAIIRRVIDEAKEKRLEA
jgi:PAS domain S-box-containing protein